MNGGDKVDLLSRLPDTVICSIIGLLPIKEAGRTSVLSHRWRPVWKCIPRIDFDPKPTKKPYKGNTSKTLLNIDVNEYGSDDIQCIMPKKQIERAISLIDQVFLSHRLQIHNCRITHYRKNFISGDVERWIEHLKETRRSIQELALTCVDGIQFTFTSNPSKKEFELPSGFFDCRSLNVLELNKYPLRSASPFIGCENLETLSLNSVYLTDDTITSLVFNCVFLEYLNIRWCFGFQKLKICNSNLKVLELEALSVDAIDIHAIYLTTLVIDTISCPPNCIKINTPNLHVFRTYRDLDHSANKKFYQRCHRCMKSSEVLERCSGLLESPHEGFHHNGYTCSFENLQKISINVDLSNIRHVIILSFIFRVCLRLQELYIVTEIEDEGRSVHDSTHCCLPHFETTYWDKGELFDSLSHHLRRVWIRGFRGHLHEMEFVKHLITKAPMIKRIMIQCHDKCSRDRAIATMDLLSIPRASIDVSIVLKPGPRSGSEGFKWKEATRPWKDISSPNSPERISILLS
ncbi:hypothetical protein HHK36_003517 [Tetracentron sinense]|uniref:FBD domain-containing protein n=1 Tax=Tetracentron sinense TaxID=13715 RepID=A0A834ZNV9_TETSI|nr:hypothetical protein HHK36_003517 [Tetracentron sinense]